MSKVIKNICGILLLIIAIVSLWYWLEKDSPVTDVSKYIETIDSLQSQIDSISTLRDSIDQKIDTITITIKKNYIQYEKDRNTILNNTTNEDYVFFINYIRSNKTRLDSINNL